MTLFDAFLLALALAMDCFTMSITCGILQRRMGGQVWLMAFLFGAFQAVMPWLGWQLTGLFEQQISSFDHWIAFALLMFLGLKKSEMLLMPLLLIGAVSFLLSVIGKYIGVKVGQRLYFRAGYLGGVLLIFIGCKVLLEHLCV